MKGRRRAILLTWAVLVALSLLAVACNSTPEPRATQAAPVEQVGTAPVEQVGTAPVEQVGTAPVEQIGTAPVEQIGTAPVEQTVAATEPVQQQAVPTKGTGETVTPSPSVVTPTVAQALTPTLVFGYTEQGQEQDLIQKQLKDFESRSYIGVVGQQYGTPDALVLAFVSREVDVAALAYNQAGLLYEQRVLTPLDQWTTGILTDALASVRFDMESVYGLPWRRSACMAHYYYLVVNSAAPQEEAEALIQFLTGARRQGERRALPGWFPTLQCCYEPWACDGLCGEVITCPQLPPYQVLRLPPEQIEPTVALANERLPHLDAVLGRIPINTAGAVSLFYEGERQSTAVALADPVPTDGFRDQLRTEGAYVGALFVDSDPEYPPGDYAVWWKCDRQPCTEPNSQVKVYLIPPGLKGKPRVIPVQFESFVDTGGQVGPPFCQVEQGSFEACWHVDGLRGCIKIGRQR